MYKLIENAHESGAIYKWFSWIEAITLTAALLVVGYKYDLLVVLLLGVISCLFVWITTFFTVLNITVNLLTSKNLPRLAKMLIGYPMAILIPTLTVLLIVITLYGFVQAA